MADPVVIISWICIFLIFVLLFTTIRSNYKGAPYIPTRRKKVHKMLTLANVQPGETVYDLGCGDGRVLIIAARKFKAKAVGIEIDLIKFLWCQFLITILGLRKKVKVILGDIFKKEYSDADIVFCFLLQSTNDKLESKLVDELDPKTRVVTNTFLFHSLPMIAMDGESGCYLYTIGLKPDEEG